MGKSVERESLPVMGRGQEKQNWYHFQGSET